MTRSTDIKSKKRGTRKRGTRKKQGGGGGYFFDWLPSFNLMKGDSTNPQSKDDALKQKLTSALNELTQILPKVKICAKESEMANEEARRAEEARKVPEAVTPEGVTPEQPTMGGRNSRRSGRGRAPPKGIPKGGPKGKKGMMVGPRKGPIIF